MEMFNQEVILSPEKPKNFCCRNEKLEQLFDEVVNELQVDKKQE